MRFFLFTALALSGVSSMPAAHAQSGPQDVAGQAQDQEARRLFEAGRAAYVDEKYRDALNYFQEAHQLSGRPQLLFNVGQAADRLGERETAATAFRGYLEAVPDAGNRAAIEARIAELEAPPQGDEAHFVIADGSDLTASRRDGLYLRGGLGLGVLSNEFSRDASTGLARSSGQASGPTIATELAIGFAVRPGLAIAGLLAFEWTTVNDIKIDGDSDKAGQVGLLGMLGGMIDWYISAEHGWHIQGGIVLTSLALQVEGDSALPDSSPFGGGFLLGGGHDWNLSRKLSIGVMARFTGTQLKADSYTHNVFAFSVLGALTSF